ncbi:nickel pincer cofactor biosynthesis protein LarB [Tuanshanicoccus lijuaniae]|uniref:nickel pincer cofactor biosynthesis protein LarB n=1 Tax=Aerococcaceae bacterium zg-1292 TaxID=2774330 RepID=UPI001937215B|nr:nickel pincer cofactor biosynthesis protein LarB [Aerococcaceae bacterium zg-1292]MBF6625124.1 nickel pincer cofactor biosynthesis protein LarB [Aerococcaceae bacterium zg-BR9]MBF6978252.1 nickel pincer cofactor biosynthesis protein LarB [Aerococcaceae bacterium zg-BR22]MBS4456467.1 nickel pincer cofactor biosynthesis protein LarB [Aerococcaceae bacterium zg-A91]MBS4458317.1 nickel pincer cofactor biosynthesis protein LarB [Aerococcaceae bacterium zg-BR33]
MDLQDLKAILAQYKDGAVSLDEVILQFKQSPFDDLDFAKIDHHRGIRQGISEVIYGEGKTDEHILAICQNMLSNQQKNILITRISQSTADYIAAHIPVDYHPIARLGIVGKIPEPTGKGKIIIATGGTSDHRVAEEAALTAEMLGNEVVRLYDVGVSGIHRLLAHMDVIMEAKVIVAIAGMEGALPTVIGGLADCPVIGVPTSVGYGTNLGGVTALLSMLNSCASGVSVVNIDNGFGGGYLASMINHN